MASTTTTRTSAVLETSTNEAVAAEPLDEEALIAEEATDTLELPTVQLSALDEEHGLVQGDVGSVVAVAENIVTSSRDLEVYGGQSTRQIDFSNVRAEFISVTFYKARRDDLLGVTFDPKAMDIRITGIVDNSLASDSPLRVGDRVLSVDSKDCANDKMNGEGVARILQRATGNVTLVLHNAGGDADLVESMIMKSNKDEKIGLSLKADHSLTSVLVSDIKDGSKFANSLLNAGDVVMTVNGNTAGHLGPEAAADMIRTSPSRVTILAKTLRDTGVVVAQLSDRHVLNSSQPILRGDAVNTRNSTINSRVRPASAAMPSTAEDDEDKTKILARTITCVIVFVIVIAVAGSTMGGVMA
ncbi:expressed unknown protein [Seminavis robusta]|uniref:PDZ domain-containing protein n=1 Tax=Seminavis robusta TaxID=568900 RepID=A0A9N8E158_9STRA|nr:expressed unknown protein [Seminavis robusta]|eukprot:Sro404_g135930.1 n/a (357) ;mRNA; f:42617-43887